MKALSIAFLISFSLLTLSVQAGEINADTQPTYNTGSDWWLEVTPDDPDYDLYKGVQVNCFCG